MVHTRRRSGSRSRVSRLHYALKVLGISALILALFRDSGHAGIYVAGIVALATSHKLLA